MCAALASLVWGQVIIACCSIVFLVYDLLASRLSGALAKRVAITSKM